MRAGQNLQAFGLGGVGRDRAVEMAVGPDQVCQHPGVELVALRPRGPLPIPITINRLRVERVDLITGIHERSDKQTPVSFRTDDDLTGVRRMVSHELVELGDAVEAFGESSRGPERSGFVHQRDVVVVIGPVVSNEQHPVFSSPVATGR